MSLRGVSASALERIAACPASTTLTRVREESPAAERGKAIHAYLAAVVEKGRDAALAEAPDDWREACAAIELDGLPIMEPEAYAAEVAYALDVESGVAREVGRNIGREYGDIGPTEIVGASDWEAITHDAVIVIDVKTGSAVTHPMKNPQLRFLARAASQLRRKTRAYAGILYVHPDKGSHFSWTVFDAFDLAVIGNELRALAVQVREAKEKAAKGEPLTFTRGAHCRYCPAFDVCPAQAALIREVLAFGPEMEFQTVETLLGNGAKATAFRRVKDLKMLVGRLEARVTAFASMEPIELGDGKVYGPAPGPERISDGNTAYRVLAEAYGETVANAACAIEYTTSKGAIEKAMKIVKEHEGGSIKDHVAKAMTRLRAAGAASQSMIVKEHVKKGEP
jgi:hypothetical protein